MSTEIAYLLCRDQHSPCLRPLSLVLVRREALPCMRPSLLQLAVAASAPELVQRHGGNIECCTRPVISSERRFQASQCIRSGMIPSMATIHLLCTGRMGFCSTGHTGWCIHSRRRARSGRSRCKSLASLMLFKRSILITILQHLRNGFLFLGITMQSPAANTI